MSKLMIKRVPGDFCDRWEFSKGSSVAKITAAVQDLVQVNGIHPVAELTMIVVSQLEKDGEKITHEEKKEIAMIFLGEYKEHKESQPKSRFTFEYEAEEECWKIVDQRSNQSHDGDAAVEWIATVYDEIWRDKIISMLNERYA